MTEREHRIKRHAREVLVEDARRAKRWEDYYLWEERALASKEGAIVGRREIDAISRVVWGLL